MEAQERMEILKMVADKIITVEEAERLLKVLSEGDAGAHEKGGQESKSSQDRKIDIRVRKPMEWLEGVLSDIGPTVEGIVSDALGSIGVVIDDDDEKLDDAVEITEHSIELEEGTEVSVVTGRKSCGGSGGDVRIRGVSDHKCVVVNSGPGLRIRKNPKHLIISMPAGELELELPNRLAALQVKLLHGDISVAGIESALKLKTLGGNITMTDIAGETIVKTMGGHITVSNLNPVGSSSIVTMGGNIAIGFAQNVDVKGRAITMGGTVDVGPEIKNVDRRSHFIKSEINFSIGEWERGTVKIKTMGGNIRIGMTEAAANSNPDSDPESKKPPIIIVKKSCCDDSDLPTPPDPPTPPESIIPPEPPTPPEPPAPPPIPLPSIPPESIPLAKPSSEESRPDAGNQSSVESIPDDKE